MGRESIYIYIYICLNKKSMYFIHQMFFIFILINEPNSTFFHWSNRSTTRL